MGNSPQEYYDGLNGFLLFSSLENPMPSVRDNSFSQTVCTIDKENRHGIAYYDFASMEWVHCDESVFDHVQEVPKVEFMWYVPVTNTELIDWD